MKIIKGLLLGVFLVVAGLVGFTNLMAWQAEREVPPNGRFVEIDGQRHIWHVGALSLV